MSGTYPPALRSVLKAVPCLVMCMASSYVFWIATYAFLRHEHDHVPKFSFKYCLCNIDPLKLVYLLANAMIAKELFSKKCLTMTLMSRHSLDATNNS